MTTYSRAAPPGCHQRTAAGVLAALLLAATGNAGTYRLASGTADGGGSYAQGARFRVEGTAGQPDAGWLQGQHYTLHGGFWPTTNAVSDVLFSDSFED